MKRDVVCASQRPRDALWRRRGKRACLRRRRWHNRVGDLWLGRRRRGESARRRWQGGWSRLGRGRVKTRGWREYLGQRWGRQRLHRGQRGRLRRRCRSGRRRWGRPIHRVAGRQGRRCGDGGDVWFDAGDIDPKLPAVHLQLYDASIKHLSDEMRPSPPRGDLTISAKEVLLV